MALRLVAEAAAHVLFGFPMRRVVLSNEVDVAVQPTVSGGLECGQQKANVHLQALTVATSVKDGTPAVSPEVQTVTPLLHSADKA